MRRFSFTVLTLILVQITFGQNIVDWRGPGRTGVYNETGLLTEWPESGPELLWSVENIYKGYSSVSIANNTIYLTGINDNNDVLIALDMQGNIKWQTAYGRAWDGSYAESRCTPTIENDKVYVSSGLGDITCLNAFSGKIIWAVKASEIFEGAYGRWGLAESLLILNDKVFFTPGGNKTTILAFNKLTGELIWQSESINDDPSYVSPLIINRNGKKLIVTVTANYVIGVLPVNGKILWKFDYGSLIDEGGRNNQTNTPLYYDGKIFVTSGYNHKCLMLNLSEDAESVSKAWVNSLLDVHHGGVVKVSNYIYGSNWQDNRMGNWICLDWNTGELKYDFKWINKGSIISAEGKLYCYEEKSGNIALVNATPEKFDIISSFKIPPRTGPYWSHPVIKDGILYIRNMDALMAFDIKLK
ncbi:PQQ-binding-like beta-propeller repeat protein [Bacteroidota bacterium]